jgi:hypothetical protein
MHTEVTVGISSLSQTCLTTTNKNECIEANPRTPVGMPSTKKRGGGGGPPPKTSAATFKCHKKQYHMDCITAAGRQGSARRKPKNLCRGRVAIN